ncbi:MAG: hypothetical protein VB104_11040 [Candidatus Limiplasma sp.]|nr:hypothetical protein [Candidatus Limiplasma sp.]
MSGEAYRAPWLVTAAQVFAAADAPLYAVGGIVRNDCMGLPASDVDLCGPSRPEQVAAFCEESAVRTVLRAAHFGTVELHVADSDGRHMGEYTTFRVDSYRGGHQPFAVRFADTLEVDALRRDFSVNALYRRLLPEGPGPIHDPTGGLTHLQRGILHTVTEDPDLVLQDDGLRILRAARFQAELGLRPTGALLASAQKYAPLLSQIARERLRDELAKLLTADTRYPTLRREEAPVPAGLRTLRAVGAWPLLFPDFSADEAAMAALGTYHPPEGMPALAGKLALLFYTAEPETLSVWMQTYRFAQKDALTAAAALTATRALAGGKLTLADAMRLGKPVITHACEAFAALKAQGVACDAALDAACTLAETMRDPALPPTLRELAVRGDALLPLVENALMPRSEVGRLLEALWRATVERRVPNEREALLQLAAQLLRTDKPESRKPS